MDKGLLRQEGTDIFLILVPRLWSKESNPQMRSCKNKRLQLDMLFIRLATDQVPVGAIVSSCYVAVDLQSGLVVYISLPVTLLSFIGSCPTEQRLHIKGMQLQRPETKQTLQVRLWFNNPQKKFVLQKYYSDEDHTAWQHVSGMWIRVFKRVFLGRNPYSTMLMTFWDMLNKEIKKNRTSY